MDYNVERICYLLYKQDFDTWMKHKERSGKFGKKDIDLLKLISSKNELAPLINTFEFGVDISKLELLRVTNQNGTVSTIKLCLESSNVDYFHARHQNARNPTWPVRLRGLVRGSLTGSKVLGYSKYGHLFLIDLDTKNGFLIGRWPIDANFADSHTCFGYNPDFTGAVSNDGKVVAVVGPTLISHQDDYFCNQPLYTTHYHMLRTYYAELHQCTVKELPLHPYMDGLDCYIGLMAFNPCYQDLLYFIAEDRYKEDKDYANNTVLVLCNITEVKILAARRQVIIRSDVNAGPGCEDIGGPLFLHHGKVFIAYYIGDLTSSSFQCDLITLLDAFTLDVIALVKLSPLDITPTSIIKCKILVSTCQTELAVFTRKTLDSRRNREADEIQVYRITDCCISLKNLCRQTIVKNISRSRIDELTMLPSELKDYLKF